MKTYNLILHTNQDIELFIKENLLNHYNQVVVQVYTGVMSKELIYHIQQEITKYLPQAFLIGATTNGEIVDDKILNQTVLSFTVFTNTTIHSCLLQPEHFKDSMTLGEHLANQLVAPDTKVILLFVSGTAVDVQEVLNCIDRDKKKVLICGAIAGDNGSSQNAYVFDNTKISSSGVVAISLNNENLHVQTFSSYGWKEVGTPFTITEVKEKRVYSIANKNPITLLEHYLGHEFIENLPASSSEFPFQINRNGKKQYLFITKAHTDGSIDLCYKVNKGEKITFSFPNIDAIIKANTEQIQCLLTKPIESIFIFNCVARKSYFRYIVEHELNMLSQITTTTGFFSYGEICTDENGDTEYLGNTLSILAMSESDEIKQDVHLNTDMKLSLEAQGLMALSNLVHASTKDIEELHASMEESEQRYKSLFENNTDVVFSTDLDGYITSVNQAFVEAFGYTEEEVIHKSSLEFIKVEDISRVKEYISKANDGKNQSFNMEICSKTGKVQIFQMTSIPIIIHDNKVGIYCFAKNITEQKVIEEKISHLAYHDTQTGLPNRLKFTETLDLSLKKAKMKKQKLAVVFIDIDRFKMINDTLGHYAGDEILKQIANSIQACLPVGSYFGRFAGDKFTYLLLENVESEYILQLSHHILDMVTSPLVFKDQELFVTASIGVSIFPNDGMDEITLLKNADIAVNQAKQSGGNRIEFYASEMNQQSLQRLELESYLRKAIEKDELFLCYQPLIDLSTGKIYGSEALIRWNHPKLGLVSPGDFIPLAEETGLIHDIGGWVLRTACKQNQVWHDNGFGKLTIAINVSAHQFQRSNFVEEVKLALLESGLAPQYLDLELTESIMLRNVSYSITVMKELQKLGVKVSIDDFGTGYSSLSYLKNLPINTLKIDRSFINNLKLDTSDIAIVKAIITMGYGLEVKIVAEGVETVEQMQLLKELKCHYAQGFYIHKPLSIKDFEKGIRQTDITQ